jgi:hypothetical protein
MRFIYVFDDAVKKELMSRGFVLLKSDERNQIYVFQNDLNQRLFDLNENTFTLSDTLTF